MVTSGLPITSIAAALLALFLIPLSMRVGILRYRKKIWLLDGGDPELTRRIRVQANFVEYVPIALVLMALVEFGGASAALLWSLGGLLVVSRVVHAVSLSRSETGIGRGLGANGTFLVLLVSAGWLLWHYAASGLA